MRAVPTSGLGLWGVVLVVGGMLGCFSSTLGIRGPEDSTLIEARMAGGQICSVPVGPDKDEGLTRGRVRVMTWNIRHGQGMDGQINLERIADVILREEVDLVALQEVDRGVARTDRRDLAGELAGLTRMSCVFSNNFHYQGGEYGNAILSRFPILGWTNRHYRMLREGEQRGLLETTVDVAGSPLRVFSTHLDPRRDDRERLENVDEIRRALESRPGIPVIVAGDFNDIPGQPVHTALTRFLRDGWAVGGTGTGYTYRSDKPDRRIDYVLFSPHGSLELERIRVIQSLASDHLPVVAEFRFPCSAESPLQARARASSMEARADSSVHLRESFLRCGCRVSAPIPHLRPSSFYLPATSAPAKTLLLLWRRV